MKLLHKLRCYLFGHKFNTFRVDGPITIESGETRLITEKDGYYECECGSRLFITEKYD